MVIPFSQFRSDLVSNDKGIHRLVSNIYLKVEATAPRVCLCYKYSKRYLCMLCFLSQCMRQFPLFFNARIFHTKLRFIWARTESFLELSYLE